MDQDSLYFIGGQQLELKHLGGTRYLLKGGAVVFSEENADGAADGVKDYFTPDETNYGLDENGSVTTNVYFNHGKDFLIKGHPLGVGRGRLTKDHEAIWLEHHLDIAQKYDELVVRLIEKRQKMGLNFGLSAGVAKKLVERSIGRHSNKMTKWLLGVDENGDEGGDISITLTPADWRQTAMPIATIEQIDIKALLTSGDETNPEAQIPEADDSAVSADDFKADDVKNNRKNEEKNLMTLKTVDPKEHESMAAELKKFKDAANEVEKNELKAEIQLLKTDIQLGKTGVERLEADLKKWQGSFPRQSNGFAGGNDTEQDETKSLGDFALQMRKGVKGHERIVTEYKATMTEADGESAGYRVPDQQLGMLNDRVALTSAIPGLVDNRQVQSPTGWIGGHRVDVVPTAGVGDTGTASGAKSVKRGETIAGTETVFKTRRLTWNIQGNQISGIVAVSIELKNDAPFIEGEIVSTISDVKANKREFFVLNGNGTNEPQGIQGWAGTVTQVAGTAGSFTLPDAKAMLSKTLVGVPGQNYWVMHPSSLPDLLSLGDSATDSSIQRDLTNEAPMRLYGDPVLLSQHMPQKGNDGAVLRANFMSYIMFNLGGLNMQFSEHARIEQGEVIWVFNERMDGKPSFPGAVTLADAQGGFQQSTFVKLLNA